MGALSVVGTAVMDSHAGPCLCLDALPTTNICCKSGGEKVLFRNSLKRKQVAGPGTSLGLGNTFLCSSKGLKLSSKAIPRVPCMSLRKYRKGRSLKVVNEVAGQYEEGFGDVKRQLLNYFTFKAVRTVLHQLYEMNPTQYKWFYNYVASNHPGDGKRFIRNLGKEKQELAERVMVTRLHLYGKWVKKCDHTEIYNQISDENLELMRERLIETVIWPSDDSNTQKVG